MSNPYRNQHAECCNASFSYEEYLPTCRSCGRQICGEAACVIAGSLDDSRDGRPTYICKEPDCAQARDDERKRAVA